MPVFLRVIFLGLSFSIARGRGRGRGPNPNILKGSLSFGKKNIVGSYNFVITKMLGFTR